MTIGLQGTTVQWGSIVFSLDGELLHQIAVSGARTGHYRFDEEAIAHLEEYLGVFLGYMSGPLPVSMSM